MRPFPATAVISRPVLCTVWIVALLGVSMPSVATAHHDAGFGLSLADPGTLVSQADRETHFVGGSFSLADGLNERGPWLLVTPVVGVALGRGFHLDAQIPIAISQHEMHRQWGVKGGQGLSNTLISVDHSRSPESKPWWLLSAGLVQWLPSVAVPLGLGPSTAATALRGSVGYSRAGLGIQGTVLARFEYGPTLGFAPYGNLTVTAQVGQWLQLALGVTASPRWVQGSGTTPEWLTQARPSLAFRFGERFVLRLGASVPLDGEGLWSGSIGFIVPLGSAEKHSCTCTTALCSCGPDH